MDGDEVIHGVHVAHASRCIYGIGWAEVIKSSIYRLDSVMSAWFLGMVLISPNGELGKWDGI